MRLVKKSHPVVTIFLLISLMLLLAASSSIAENAIAQPSSGDVPQPMLKITGTIDRIGDGEMVINDTYYKLSDNLDVSTFKKGDYVVCGAIMTDNGNYEILRMELGKSPRAKKRTTN